MEQHASIDIEASVARAWAVLCDVERWPEWTASMRSVTLLDGELRVGARARVDQPRIPTTVWTVTGLTEATTARGRRAVPGRERQDGTWSRRPGPAPAGPRSRSRSRAGPARSSDAPTGR